MEGAFLDIVFFLGKPMVLGSFQVMFNISTRETSGVRHLQEPHEEILPDEQALWERAAARKLQTLLRFPVEFNGFHFLLTFSEDDW
jgi:hypothetical protein